MDTVAKSNMPKKMFVYGTLRRDLGYRAKDGYSGTAEGLCRMPGVMISLGGFPGVVPWRSSDEREMGRWGGKGMQISESIIGQLISYEHTSDEEWDEVLGKTDAYEGTASGMYTRQRVAVTPVEPPTDSPSPVETWVYIYNATHIHPRNIPSLIIPSGDWADRNTRYQL